MAVPASGPPKAVIDGADLSRDVDAFLHARRRWSGGTWKRFPSRRAAGGRGRDVPHTQHAPPALGGTP